MTNTTAIETIEDYLVRLEDAVEEQGEICEFELVGGENPGHLDEVDLSLDDAVMRSELTAEIQAQLRWLELWRKDLTVRVDSFNLECCFLSGLNLHGTLWTSFTVLRGERPLWKAEMNLDCDHDLSEEAGERGFDEKTTDEAEERPESDWEWWLGHGVDLDAIAHYEVSGVDVFGVELMDGEADEDHEPEGVRSSSNLKVLRDTKPSLNNLMGGGLLAAELFHPNTPHGYWKTHGDELLTWHLTYLACFAFFHARGQKLIDLDQVKSMDGVHVEKLFYEVVMPLAAEWTLLSAKDCEVFEAERVLSALGAGTLDWQHFASHLDTMLSWAMPQGGR